MKNVKRFVAGILLAGVLASTAAVTMDIDRNDVYQMEYKVTESVFDFVDTCGVTSLIHQLKKCVQRF